ncbi:hypothetical protein [Butyrivibrio sp. INlla16]|uniref:hypothetical protein n=1 Tax=Butyrivibrio sp. INlla16 TaxID=1520807 RepID=UPI00088BAF0F|nr:hypothetical protein [Butyrivibrio sp. INlla16]SDB22070.1 hypothetical protein SAMN02910263_01060 [Butyrivibrio sp. INlla16]
MKKEKTKGMGFAIGFTVAFVGAIALIAVILIMSNKLRKFKVDMFVLFNEADICVGEGVDGQYRISRDNLTALSAILQSTRGYFTFDKPETSEEINLKITHDGEDWNLSIARAGDNKLKLVLTGERNYEVYVKDNKKFEDIQKCVSGNGYIAANKPFNGKK